MAATVGDNTNHPKQRDLVIEILVDVPPGEAHRALKPTAMMACRL
jgi:hypothetical protein